MNRLMRRDKSGKSDSAKKINVVFLDEKSKSRMTEIFESLASYEDLGLTPEQIREVDRLYSEKCKEVAELKKSPWIPVTERLPEASFDLVLICNRDGYIDIVWGWYIEDKQKRNTGNDVSCNDIVAWMLLPEPYAESVKE